MNFLSDGDTKGAASKLFRLARISPFCSAWLVGDCKGGTEMNSFRYKCELFKVVSCDLLSRLVQVKGGRRGRQKQPVRAATQRLQLPSYTWNRCFVQGQCCSEMEKSINANVTQWRRVTIMLQLMDFTLLHKSCNICPLSYIFCTIKSQNLKFCFLVNVLLGYI